MSGDLLPLLLIGPCLAAAIGFEIATRGVPVLLSVLLGATALLVAALVPGEDGILAGLLARLVAGMVGFWLAFALYTARLSDTDQVSFVTALTLAIPPAHLPAFGLLFTGVLAAATALSMVLHLRARQPAAEGSATPPPPEGPGAAAMPFGLSSRLPLALSGAVAGLILPWVAMALGG